MKLLGIIGGTHSCVFTRVWKPVVLLWMTKKSKLLTDALAQFVQNILCLWLGYQMRFGGLKREKAWTKWEVHNGLRVGISPRVLSPCKITQKWGLTCIWFGHEQFESKCKSAKAKPSVMVSTSVGWFSDVLKTRQVQVLEEFIRPVLVL